MRRGFGWSFLGIVALSMFMRACIYPVMMGIGTELDRQEQLEAQAAQQHVVAPVPIRVTGRGSRGTLQRGQEGQDGWMPSPLVIAVAGGGMVFAVAGAGLFMLMGRSEDGMPEQP